MLGYPVVGVAFLVTVTPRRNRICLTKAGSGKHLMTKIWCTIQQIEMGAHIQNLGTLLIEYLSSTSFMIVPDLTAKMLVAVPFAKQ